MKIIKARSLGNKGGQPRVSIVWEIFPVFLFLLVFSSFFLFSPWGILQKVSKYCVFVLFGFANFICLFPRVFFVFSLGLPPKSLKVSCFFPMFLFFESFFWFCPCGFLQRVSKYCCCYFLFGFLVFQLFRLY